jgi:hypothetical protein
MIITELCLHARSLGAQQQFFGQQFGLVPLESTPQRLCFQVGHTKLVFTPNPEWQGVYHYAFQIPAPQFEQAVTWLQTRCPLLKDGEGQQQFRFADWNARAVYFADGDGNIAELIAHDARQTATTGDFSGNTIIGLSEIGLVSDAVQATVAALGKAYGLTPYLGRAHPEFTAVGDIDGLFIVVKNNRPWLPTGQPAQCGWFSATIATGGGQHVFSTDARG